MSKTIALAATAAAIALGTTFAGASSAEAGYKHRHHGFKHVHRYHSYKPHYVYKRAYRPVYVYRPAYVYKPVCAHWGWTYSHGYKKWGCVAW